MCQDEFQKMNVKHQQLLFGRLGEVVEWTGTTRAVDRNNFNWADNVVGDISESKLVRVEIKGTSDSFIAFTETKENLSKKV